MTYYLRIRGACPTKKNAYQRATQFNGTKGVRIKSEAKAKMAALQLQMQSLWKYGRPLEHPDISVKFTVSNPALDNDGMWSTVLDLLQPKGSNTILNDNIRHFNGKISILSADICAVGDELVELWISPKSE